MACCGEKGAKRFCTYLLLFLLIISWIAGKFGQSPVPPDERPSAASCMVASQRGCFYDPFSDTILGWTIYILISLCLLLAVVGVCINPVEDDNQEDVEEGTSSSDKECF